MQLLYRELCPNDGGDILSSRLEKGLVCEKCINEDEASGIYDFNQLVKILEEKGRLQGGLREYYVLNQKLYDFENFSKNVFESLTNAQRSWFIKAAKAESFAITYPTGLGKTTFGMLYSLYVKFKNEDRKIVFLVPTRLLVAKVIERLKEFASKVLIDVRIISSLENKKEELIEALKNRSFDIAVLTSKFLLNNKSLLLSKEFRGIIDLVFVDDVDSVLKSSKAIDVILNLIGFDLENEALMKLKQLTRRTGRDSFEEKMTLLEEVRKYKANNKIGQLIFSSATTRFTSSRIRLLRHLLDFEPGSSLEVFRNVLEFYKYVPETKQIKEATSLISELGKGGLIFVSVSNSSSFIDRLISALSSKNFKAEVVSSKVNAKKILDSFERGEIDLLIGHATFYGPLVRGIDLPGRVKYAIFVGVPKFKFSFEIFERNPLRTLWLASIVVNFIEDFERRRSILDLSAKLKNEVQKYTPEALRALTYIKQETKLRVLELTKILYDELIEVLRDEKIISALEEKKRLRVIYENNKRFLLIPDSLTYIQASGRTSRMYYGGITTGLSIVLVDDKRIFEGLKYQLSFRGELFNFHSFDYFLKKKDEILEIIHSEREAIINKEVRAAKSMKEAKLRTALFVVESPTKARTISSFFGKPVVRLVKDLRVYECVTDKYILYITATRGHIFELVYTHSPASGIYYGIIKKHDEFIPIYSTIKKCRNCGEQFTEYKEKGKCPYCGSTMIEDQINTVKALQELAQESDLVIIATDPDSEGEKIAKDVYLVVKPFAKEIKRAEMHEITLNAFLKALDNLKEINDRLVLAQILRRIGDRWVGFSLSNLVQQEFKRKTMGVGRVQTPVLSWIVENYRKYKKKRKKRLILNIKINETFLKVNAKPIKIRRWTAGVSRKIKKQLINSKLEISEISTEKVEVPPPRPFSTSELLTSAVPKLRTSSDKIMRLAQDLFEAGLITYHRTDSHYISYVGFEIANKYLEEKGLLYLLRKKQYEKAGTHECIRPTRPLDRQALESAIATGQIRIPIQMTPQHYQLYDLIFKTFIASQMKPANVIKYKISFKPLTVKLEEELQIEVEPLEINVEADENSFVKIYPILTYPQLKDGIKEMEAVIVDVRFVREGKLLFTEEEIIREMKKEGIGRPSTYSFIIKRLIDHNYVMLSPIRKFFIPMKLAMDLIMMLKEKFQWVIDVKLTRKFERLMDEIEEGKLSYDEVKRVFNEFFEEYYLKVVEKIEEIKPVQK